MEKFLQSLNTASVLIQLQELEEYERGGDV